MCAATGNWMNGTTPIRFQTRRQEDREQQAHPAVGVLAEIGPGHLFADEHVAVLAEVLPPRGTSLGLAKAAQHRAMTTIEESRASSVGLVSHSGPPGSIGSKSNSSVPGASIDLR